MDLEEYEVELKILDICKEIICDTLRNGCVPVEVYRVRKMDGVTEELSILIDGRDNLSIFMQDLLNGVVKRFLDQSCNGLPLLYNIDYVMKNIFEYESHIEEHGFMITWSNIHFHYSKLDDLVNVLRKRGKLVNS